MPTHVRWVLSRSASSLHAVSALAQGAPVADARWAEALRPAADQFAQLAAETGLPVEAYFAHLVPLAAGIENNRELVEIGLRKTLHGMWTPELHSHLVAVVADVENTTARLQPDALDDLERRSAPLREQWDARGPGALAAIGRLTEPDLIVERADVVVVHPIAGGGGAAHLPYNSARIEAVLTNPQPELPEVVRLAWMLAQLHCDLPMHSEEIPPERLGRVAALAMLRPALAAGEQVELCRDDEANAKRAIETWRLSESDAAQTAETLDTWWGIYCESTPPWSVGLRALDQMLAGEHCSAT